MHRGEGHVERKRHAGPPPGCMFGLLDVRADSSCFAGLGVAARPGCLPARTEKKPISALKDTKGVESNQVLIRSLCWLAEITADACEAAITTKPPRNPERPSEHSPRPGFLPSAGCQYHRRIRPSETVSDSFPGFTSSCVDDTHTFSRVEGNVRMNAMT